MKLIDNLEGSKYPCGQMCCKPEELEQGLSRQSTGYFNEKIESALKMENGETCMSLKSMLQVSTEKSLQKLRVHMTNNPTTEAFKHIAPLFHLTVVGAVQTLNIDSVLEVLITMENLTLRDKIEIVRLVGDNVLSAREAAREFNNRHPDRRMKPTRVQKILATKGRKQIGVTSSAERGQHYTAVCCMNAIETFVPPAFIFPRKRFEAELMDNAPVSSVAFCQENGWKGLQVLAYTKSNGIILFCLPEHCSRRVQPLDVGFFAPLQIYYNQDIQKCLKRNPDRAVTHFQVTELFNNAYLKAATPSNTISSLKKTEISPLDPDIFEDWEFGPASTTYNEKPEPIIDNMTEKNRGKDMPKENMNDDNNNKANSESLHEVEVDQNVSTTSVKNISIEQIEELSPFPKAPRRDTKRERKRGKTGVINSTPDLEEIKEKKKEVLDTDRRKTARAAKRFFLSFKIDQIELLPNELSDLDGKI
ncbi:hypothetical protein MML48_3g00019389 [Holotrichia oblita]|uniref:Uncharacterized protein n=1 Tax=Holotrichia oblita TaxID=644536 RepID=A0ACB9TD20_HOLOL|nr:hypothetical protein MML48_3g00019389 [Holotrichia oblita]